MKKIIIALAALAGFNTAVLAQAVTATPGTAQTEKKQRTPEEISKKSAANAEKKLGLSAQQKADWEVAALKRALVNQPLHEKLKGSTTPEERQAIHKEIKANNDAFETSVNFFLTADQKTKFTAMKAERMKAKKKEMKKDFNESHVDYGE
jgi:hypothetical protein